MEMDNIFEEFDDSADSASGREMLAPSDDSTIEQQDAFERWEAVNVDQGGSKQHHGIDDYFETPAGGKQELSMVDDDDTDSIERSAGTLDVQDPFESTVNDQACEQELLMRQAHHSIDGNIERLDGVEQVNFAMMSCKELSMVDDAMERSSGTFDLHDPFKILRTVTDQDCEQVDAASILEGLENQASEWKTVGIDEQISEQKRQVQVCDELMMVGARGPMVQERQVDEATKVENQASKQKAEDIDDQISEQNRQAQNPYELTMVKNRGAMVQERQVNAATTQKSLTVHIQASKQNTHDISDQASEQKRQVQNRSICYEPQMGSGSIAQERQDFDDQTSEQLQNPHFCDDRATSQKKQLNILLLGETGVGKSTMINAFANYIKFQSMEDAASPNQDMIALVPMAFTHVDQNYQAHEIKFGEPDPNEQHKTSGQSATQACRSYTFPLSENEIVHLIDTPGIGDTRGVKQDQANFSQMLAYLANYNEIHGICIMLKPNNSRLNITFSFCIKELLHHLHRSASANIVFLFTYARGSLYTPGDTVMPLKALLKQVLDVHPNVVIPFNESTVYCVDNEAIRLLVASKKGFSFSGRDRTSFSESWSRATEECKRMVRHFKSIEPHKVMETLSLNTAASLVMKLQQPLASVISTIHENLALFEKKKKELKDFKGNPDELKSEMEVVELQTIELAGGAATVCTNVSCCETAVLTESEQIETRYKVICHQPCTSTNKLTSYFCSAISLSGKCNVCRCSVRHHMRITYVPQLAYRKIRLLSAVPEKVNVNMQYKEVKQRSLEWEEEVNAISKAAVYFTLFLKSNTIATYSNDMQAYVKHQIAMEEASATVRVAFIKSLREFVKRYEEDVQEAQKAGKEIRAAEVVKMANSLYKLRHTGATLQGLVEKVTTMEQRTAQLYVKSCPPPPRGRKWL